MRWYSIKDYAPPMEIACMIFTESNYCYMGTLIDADDFSIWSVDSECNHQAFNVYGVTHFCIPEPVEREE